MDITFDLAFAHVVDHSIEGGYSNDPRDPGGETNFGISKRAYPAEDIKNMTRNRAMQLYKRDYWDAVKGDQLPSPLNFFVFDAAVNQGVDPAIKMLQKAVGVAQDGVIGPVTLQAAQKSTQDSAAVFMAARAMRYVGTRNFDRFGAGWFNRLFRQALKV